MIHATSKAMADAGDAITPEEKAQLETAIAALKEAMKGNDKAVIEAKTKELTDVSGKMAERCMLKKVKPEPEPKAVRAQTGEQRLDRPRGSKEAGNPMS